MGTDRLTLRQDLVADGLELALQVAKEIVDCFGERGGGVIGSGFVVHLLDFSVGLGGLRWLRSGREGVGSLEECSVRHGLIVVRELRIRRREGARSWSLRIEVAEEESTVGAGHMLTADASFVDILSYRCV